MRPVDALGYQDHVGVDLIAGKVTGGEKTPVKAGVRRGQRGDTVLTGRPAVSDSARAGKD